MTTEVFQLVGKVRQVVAAKAEKLDERTSGRYKDVAERCWMSLFLHGQHWLKDLLRAL